MPIDYQAQQAVLHGEVSVDDAEALLAWLQAQPRAGADLADCTHLHPAVLQVLLAAALPVTAWPRAQALHAWLAPLWDAPQP